MPASSASFPPRAPAHRGFGARFRLWGWAMVLVVLLSAAPTGSQLRIRPVGSAFDPAAVSVAVSPRRAKFVKAIVTDAGDKRQAPVFYPVPPALAAAPPVLLAVAAGEAAAWGVAFAAPARASPLARDYAARAPPQA